MRRFGILLALLMVVPVPGCQPDVPRRSPAGGEADSVPSSRAEERAAAPPSRYAVFDTVRAEAPPPRVTLHMLVDADASRDRLRAAFHELLREYSQRHTDVVALRAVGYVGRPVAGDARELELVPVAWGEWLPPDGWYEATEASRDALHRIYFYHGGPPPWHR